MSRPFTYLFFAFARWVGREARSVIPLLVVRVWRRVQGGWSVASHSTREVLVRCYSYCFQCWWNIPTASRCPSNLFFLLFVRVSLLLQPEQRSVTKSYVHFSTPGGIRFPRRLGRNEVAVGGCEADFAKVFATQGVGEATPKTLLHVVCSVIREIAESAYTSIGGCRGGKTGRWRKKKECVKDVCIFSHLLQYFRLGLLIEYFSKPLSLSLCTQTHTHTCKQARASLSVFDVCCWELPFLCPCSNSATSSMRLHWTSCQHPIILVFGGLSYTAVRLTSSSTTNRERETSRGLLSPGGSCLMVWWQKHFFKAY